MSLEHSLQSLSREAHALNDRTDELNGFIASVEERLRLSGTGLTCWLDATEHHMNQGQWESKKGLGDCSFPLEHFRIVWVLGYTKTDSKWCLAVRRMGAHEEWTQDGDSESCSKRFLEPLGDPTPLLGAPRSVRVEAIAKLKPLVDAMTRKTVGFVHAIEAAKKALPPVDVGSG